MKPFPVGGAIFDLDGVLVDTACTTSRPGSGGHGEQAGALAGTSERGSRR
jgi:phosphoglycolate phosphatase-like HAD superfamily hydrolase